VASFFYGFLAGFANTGAADKTMPFSIAPSDFSHFFLFCLFSVKEMACLASPRASSL
jgi:hypothetical protein